ncbi:MAG TPA: hypothetical protein VE130_05690, partial [Nitrososphaeraceae archaeon]|nr:hypothetical protein [Nitrososphaeraceae archaeon]
MNLSRVNVCNLQFAIVYFLMFGLTALVFENISLQQEAFADGLTQENLPPASLGDREGSLFVKISPPIFTTQTKEDAYLQFR